MFPSLPTANVLYADEVTNETYSQHYNVLPHEKHLTLPEVLTEWQLTVTAVKSVKM